MLVDPETTTAEEIWPESSFGGNPTVRGDDLAVQCPLRQSRPRKPFPESLPRDEKRLLPATTCRPNCGGSRSYPGEDTAEQLELMRSAFRIIRTRAGDRRTGAAGPRANLEVCRAHPVVSPVRNIRPARCGAEPFTAVGLGGGMLPAAVSAGRGASWLCHD